jgi:hypothetical protein
MLLQSYLSRLTAGANGAGKEDIINKYLWHQTFKQIAYVVTGFDETTKGLARPPQ